MFTVEDVFNIKGRGVVLTGWLTEGYKPGYKTGDKIVIKRPYGPDVYATIRGIEQLNNCFGSSRENIGLLLSEDIAKGDVPRGSVVTIAG
jgi:translation elongation factor EF-Tu-like GTPase